MLIIEGEYYNISCCMAYPINILAIENILTYLSKSCEFIEAEYYESNSTNFKFHNAIEDMYKVLNFKNNFISNIRENTLINLDMKMFNSINARFFIEYFDNQFYSVNLMMSYENIIEIKGNSCIIKDINDTELEFMKIFKPLYAKIGIEKGVISLNEISNLDYENFYEDYFINEYIYESLDDRIKSIIEKKSNFIRLNNIGILVRSTTICEKEKNYLAAAIIKQIKNIQ